MGNVRNANEKNVNREKERKSNRFTFKNKMSYYFDNLMTKGVFAEILVLLAVTVVVILVFGVGIALFTRNNGAGFYIWQSFLHAIDSGTIAGDEGSIPYMLSMLAVTLFGLLFTGTLIGILNNGIQEKVEELAKGKSIVLVKGHTVVLGFNDTTISILGELVKANENQKGRVPVVIMDEENVVDMDDRVSSVLPGRAHTNMLFRSGCVYNISDLEICALDTCRSIIINTASDFDTVKAILACKKILDENDPDEKVYISAVIYNSLNEAEARMAGGNRVRLLIYPAIMAKIIAGSARQKGLSSVYAELFSYDRDEIYCEAIAAGNGVDDSTPLRNLNNHVRNAVVIGGIPKEKDNAAAPYYGAYQYGVSEPLHVFSFSSYLDYMDTKRAGDGEILTPCSRFGEIGRFFIIEADDNELTLLDPQEVKKDFDESLFRTAPYIRSESSTLLILGRSPFLNMILSELDGYYSENNKNATVIIADDEPIDPRAIRDPDGNQFSHITVDLRTEPIDVYDYHVLCSLITEDVTSVLLLTENKEDRDREDEGVLLQLIYLREIRKDPRRNFNITCEMNLDKNRKLAEVTGDNDYIVGTSITALLITQISQNKESYEMFREILSNDGSEIYLKKAMEFLNIGSDAIETDFYTLNEACVRKNEILLGLRTPSEDGEEGGLDEIDINPPRWKDGQPVLFRITKDTELVTLSVK